MHKCLTRTKGSPRILFHALDTVLVKPELPCIIIRFLRFVCALFIYLCIALRPEPNMLFFRLLFYSALLKNFTDYSSNCVNYSFIRFHYSQRTLSQLCKKSLN